VTTGSRIAVRRALWERRLAQLAGYLNRTTGRQRQDPRSQNEQRQSEQQQEDKQ
jgi:hypothetical protein